MAPDGLIDNVTFVGASERRYEFSFTIDQSAKHNERKSLVRSVLRMLLHKEKNVLYISLVQLEDNSLAVGWFKKLSTVVLCHH